MRLKNIWYENFVCPLSMHKLFCHCSPNNILPLLVPWHLNPARCYKPPEDGEKYLKGRVCPPPPRKKRPSLLLYCEIVSPRYDRETSPMKPQHYDCLSKTWTMIIPIDILTRKGDIFQGPTTNQPIERNWKLLRERQNWSFSNMIPLMENPTQCGQPWNDIYPNNSNRLSKFV